MHFGIESFFFFCSILKLVNPLHYHEPSFDLFGACHPNVLNYYNYSTITSILNFSQQDFGILSIQERKQHLVITISSTNIFIRAFILQKNVLDESWKVHFFINQSRATSQLSHDYRTHHSLPCNNFENHGVYSFLAKYSNFLEGLLFYLDVLFEPN